MRSTVRLRGPVGRLEAPPPDPDLPVPGEATLALASPSVRGVILCHLALASGPKYGELLRRTVRSLSVARVIPEVVAAGRDEPSIVAECEAAHDVEIVRLNGGALLNRLLEARAEAWREDFILFVAPGDQVASGLRSVLRSVDENVGAAVFDHSRVDEDTGAVELKLKPRFSPDFLAEHDYVGRAVVFRPRVLESLAGDLCPAAPLRDGLLRIWELDGSIGKVGGVLLKATSSSEAGYRERIEADRALAETWIARRDRSATVIATPDRVSIRHRPTADALVSIVVPFRDRPELLRAVTESVLDRTIGIELELLLVDTGSRDPACLELLDDTTADRRVRVIEQGGVFNYSRINNYAARLARGNLLAFLNNDVEVVTPDWLVWLSGHAQQRGVGAVGPKLLYPDGSIQHGGVVVGLTHLADHALRGVNETDAPSDWVLHARNCSAVTGACCVVSAERFWAVGGFDERFRLTGSDVDLGLKLLGRGYRNVWVPQAVLVHHERQTRKDVRVGVSDELCSLESYGPLLSDGDPYWNPGLSLRSTVPRPREESDRDRPDVRLQIRQKASRVRNPAGLSDTGSVMLERYDCSDRELGANRETLQRFRATRALGTIRNAVWFVPKFDHVLRGGIHTIFRLAERLSSADRCEHTFVLTGTGDVALADVAAAIREEFPKLRFELSTEELPGDMRSLPGVDAAFCTHWTTAYHLVRFNRCRGKFYLVQDYEPAFNPADVTYGLAEATYRFGFPGICNTSGVETKYAAYGNETIAFRPATDLDLFHPAADRPDWPVRIVFYGRPQRERNGFALGRMALCEVKDKYRSDVRIISAGADYDLAEQGVEGVFDEAVLLPDMESVAQLYRNSHVGLVFMFTPHPSYQPIEFMASGCVTVTNANEATRWLIRDRENALSCRPTVSGVVEALSELVETPHLRASLAAGALETARELDWEPQLTRVCQFIRGV